MSRADIALRIGPVIQKALQRAGVRAASGAPAQPAGLVGAMTTSDAWQQWALHARDEVTAILHLNAGAHSSISANGQFLGASQQIPGLLKSLLDVPGAQLRANIEKPYFALALILAGCSHIGAAACHTVGTANRGRLPRESFNAKSDYVATQLSAAGRAAMIAATEHPGAGSLLCDAYGGAINRIAPDATAFIHRDPLFCIQYYGAGATSGWIDFNFPQAIGR